MRFLWVYLLVILFMFGCISSSDTAREITRDLHKLGLDAYVKHEGDSWDVRWEVSGYSEKEVWLGLNAIKGVFRAYEIPPETVDVHVYFGKEHLGDFNLGELP